MKIYCIEREGKRDTTQNVFDDDNLASRKEIYNIK